jgi:hypothetical protein
LPSAGRSALRASQPAAAVDCARRQASLPTCSRLIRGDYVFSSMKKKYIIIRVVLYSFAIFLICTLFYRERQLTIEGNEKLFSQVRLLQENEIQSIRIFCPNNNKLLKEAEIAIVQRLLKSAEFKTTGGHNSNTYQYEISFKLKNGQLIRLLGKIYRKYDWNRDDLYLEDVSIPHFFVDPLRIPGLGKWVLKNMSTK